MGSIEIKRVDYKNHGTSSHMITGATINLKKCEILEITDTEYSHQKIVVKLPEKKIDKMKMFEEDVNDYLDETGMDKITLVYGNTVYAKKHYDTPETELSYI